MASKGREHVRSLGLYLLARAQDHKCLICAEPILQPEGSRFGKTTVEHVFNHAHHEGIHFHGNLAASHDLCNNAKADSEPTRCEVLWLWVINRRLGLPEALTAQWDQREGNCEAALQQKAEAQWIVNR